MSNEREQFASRLEDILITKNITRRQAAELVGCTGATIGRWTRSEVPYCIVILAGLHRELGIDLNKLICGEEH